MAYRIETGRLDRAERTAAGGLRVPAAIGRSGVLTYRRADGSLWREYRPEAEAFKAASLASLRGAPVTDLHPSGPVTAESWRTLARGHVGDDPRQDGEHIAASLYVQDAALIAAIEAGERREVSAGYNVELDLTPGVAPDGTRYDAIQRDVSYNHVAIGPRGWGRAGPTVALRLDGDLDEHLEAISPADAGSSSATNCNQESSMKFAIRADGQEFTVEGDETAAKALPVALERERAQVAEIQRQLAAEKARADAAEGRSDALAEQAKKAADPATVSALVAARVRLEEQAKGVKSDLRCDGLTDRAVMCLALGLEDKPEHSDEYVRGRFDAVVASGSVAQTSRTDARVAAVTPAAGQVSVAEAARRRLIERNTDAWKGGEV